MAVKKRDFQKISQLIQEFLVKLSGEEASAELRDSLNHTLLHLQRYYKCLRTRSDSNGLSNSGLFKSLNTTLNGGVSPISPFCRGNDIFDWKWVNLDSPRLSACVGSEDFTQMTPCLIAAKNADLVQLKELIEKDSDCVNQVDSLGRSALLYTVHGNSEEHHLCMELLIDCGSDVNLIANDGSTCLHVACHDTNITAVQLLLKQKANVNVQDCEGRSPLHWAAANSSTQNIEFLVKHDADIRACDSNGLTPAMWACHFDQATNLALLQEAIENQGSNKDVLMEDIDHEGRTLIHWSVTKNGEQLCLKKLLGKETALLKDKEGRNVFLTAAKEGSVSACEEMFSLFGEDCLHQVNNKYQTALHIATICAHGSVVDLLLEKGADAHLVDDHGSSALEYALSRQLHYCTLIFLSHQSQQTHSPNLENQKNLEKNNERKSLEDSPQDMVTPSAPPFEEITVGPTNEEREKNNAEIRKRTCFDSQEHEELPKMDEIHPPKPLPRHIKQNSTEEKGSEVTSPKKPCRQQTLTRQSNVNNNVESDHDEHEFDTHTFDRKVDGEVLVLVDDVGGLAASSNEPGDNCNDSPSPLLERGHSASSAHSEQDNAENVSVSMDMGVSSIGSDSENSANDHEEDRNDNEMPFVTDHDHTQDYEPEEVNRDEERQGGFVESPSPPSSPLAVHNNSPVTSIPHPSHQRLQPLAAVDVKVKKKKEKKKKKQKLAELSAPIPPRGFAAPLEPPPARVDFQRGHPKMHMKENHIQDFNNLEQRPVNPIPPVHLMELPGGLRGHTEGGRENIYGHVGPPQGPLAFNHGQNMLKNTDFVPPHGNKLANLKMMPKATPRGPPPHSNVQHSLQGQHGMPSLPRPPPPR